MLYATVYQFRNFYFKTYFYFLFIQNFIYISVNKVQVATLLSKKKIQEVKTKYSFILI